MKQKLIVRFHSSPYLSFEFFIPSHNNGAFYSRTFYPEMGVIFQTTFDTSVPNYVTEKLK